MLLDVLHALTRALTRALLNIFTHRKATLPHTSGPIVESSWRRRCKKPTFVPKIAKLTRRTSNGQESSSLFNPPQCPGLQHEMSLCFRASKIIRTTSGDHENKMPMRMDTPTEALAHTSVTSFRRRKVFQCTKTSQTFRRAGGRARGGGKGHMDMWR